MRMTTERWFGMRSYGLAACLALLVAFGASAQTPRAGESIDVSIVNVDVQVTDKKGNRVTGLSVADFEVRENGKLQPITNFSEYASAAATASVSVEGAASAKPAAAAEPRARRTVVLFFEPVTLPAFRSKELFDSIRQLVRRVVGKGDQISIVTFVRRTRVRQEFTDDMAAIDLALDQLEKESTGVAGNPIDDNRRLVQEEVELDKEFERMAADAGMPSLIEAPSFTAIAAAKRQLFLIKQKVFALETLMHSISGAEGKKIILMATRRFGLYAGVEYFGGTVPGQYRQDLDTTTYRQSLVRTANAQGVTIYPIHPEGLLWDSPDASVTGNDRIRTSTLEEDLGRTGIDNQVLQNESAAMEEVAHATGGVTAWGSRDIAKLLPRVSDDLEAYYSLGYRMPGTGKDSTRTIVVKTRNPDYVVRSRRQAVEKSDVTKMKDRVMANLFQRVPGSSAEIPFDVVLGKIKKDGRNRWTVPLKVRVPIRALTMLPRGSNEAGEFSVYLVTGGKLGVMSEVDRKTQPFEVPTSDREKAAASHFTYELDLTVDQLVERLSIGVLDEVGKEYGLKRFTLPKR